MPLIEYDLLGNKTDKVAMAIELLQHFEPEDGYYVAYSGGKDSIVVASLVARGGCKHDIHYNVTTVDPPELVRFIISQFDTVIYHYTNGNERVFSTHGVKLLNPTNEIKGRIIHFEIPELPMRKLIVKKKFPPTRLLRYCCQDLKEINGQYRVVVTGVRWAESKSRKDNQGRVTIFSGKAGEIAEETGANFSETARGGGTEFRQRRNQRSRGKVLPPSQNIGQSNSRLDRRRYMGIYPAGKDPILQTV